MEFNSAKTCTCDSTSFWHGQMLQSNCMLPCGVILFQLYFTVFVCLTSSFKGKTSPSFQKPELTFSIFKFSGIQSCKQEPRFSIQLRFSIQHKRPKGPYLCPKTILYIAKENYKLQMQYIVDISKGERYTGHDRRERR